MTNTYLSIKLSDNIPKTITCKDILLSISQYQSMPEKIDIHGHKLTVRHIPLNRPIYKLFESKNLQDEPKGCKIDDLSSCFMGTIYVDLIAPAQQL